MNLEQLSKAFAVVSAVYAASAITINVGYMSGIGPLASEAFGLSDILQVNVFIIRNLFFLALLYGAAQGFLGWPLRMLFNRIGWLVRAKATVRSVALLIMVENTWASYVIFIGMYILMGSIRAQLSGAGVFIELIPLTLWTWFSTRYLLYLHSTSDFSGPLFLFLLAFNPFVLAFDLGETWAKYDKLDNSRVISLQYENGACVERRLLRFTSNGLILYNEFNRTYEFRTVHGIQGFAPGKGCF